MLYPPSVSCCSTSTLVWCCCNTIAFTPAAEAEAAAALVTAVLMSLLTLLPRELTLLPRELVVLSRELVKELNSAMLLSTL